MNTIFRKRHILWIKMGGLWPANSGGRLRSFHIIRELSKLQYVTVITTHDAVDMTAELRTQLPHCLHIESLPVSAPKAGSKQFLLTLLASWLSPLPVDMYKFQNQEMKNRVFEIMKNHKFDLCIVDFMTSVPNSPMTSNIPVVLFSHNVEYMIWKRLFEQERSLLKKMLLKIEWHKMRRAEQLTISNVAATIAVSREDAGLLLQLCPEAEVYSIPTGVDTDYFQPGPQAELHNHTLVFSGSMDWFPNEDAMIYFIREILPIIQRIVPDIRLIIVGRNPSQRLRDLATPDGIEVTGTVDDIRPWLCQSSVYIVPLRVGGGTRIKIYEALAMGMAVVSTTVGAEGLDLTDGLHLRLADTPALFAQHVITLLHDEALRRSLAQAGRDLVVQHYAWQQVAQTFNTACLSVLDNSRHEPPLN